MTAIIHKILLLCFLFTAGSSYAKDRASIIVLTTRDSEISALTEALECEVTAKETRAKREILHLQTDVAYVYTVRCGAGIVNAVMTAQLMIDAFDPDILVSVGLCAALDDVLAIGDLVLAEAFSRHDIGTHTDAGFVQGTAWYRSGEIRAESLMPQTNAWQKLIQVIVHKDVNGFSVVSLASGDSFIRSSLKRQWIRKKLGADIVDMSGAAIAEVAVRNDLPLVVLRQISDYADSKAGGNFSKSASAPATELGELAALVISIWSENEEVQTW